MHRRPEDAVYGDRVILVTNAALQAALGTRIERVAATVCAHIDADTTDCALCFVHEDGHPYITPHLSHRSLALPGTACWLWPEEEAA